MNETIHSITEILKNFIENIAQTRFAEIKFGRPDELAFWSLIFCGGITLGFTLRFILRFFQRRTYGQTYSGIPILRKRQEKKIRKAAYYFLILMGIIAASLILIGALGEPYLEKTKIITYEETRHVTLAIDVSGSMIFEFAKSGKCLGEIGREALKRLLTMREGKHDEYAIWLFGSQTYKISGFTHTEHAVRLLEILPYSYLPREVIEDSSSTSIMRYPETVAPKGKIQAVPHEGGTNLKNMLQMFIKEAQTKRDSRPKYIIIVTDAVLHEPLEEYYPLGELSLLAEHNITLYLLYLEPNASGELRTGYKTPELIAASKKLLEDVRRFGGKSYLIDDPFLIQKVANEIDKLEPVRTRKETVTVEEPIHGRFFAAAILILLLGIPLGLAIEVFIGRTP